MVCTPLGRSEVGNSLGWSSNQLIGSRAFETDGLLAPFALCGMAACARTQETGPAN